MITIEPLSLFCCFVFNLDVVCVCVCVCASFSLVYCFLLCLHDCYFIVLVSMHACVFLCLCMCFYFCFSASFELNWVPCILIGRHLSYDCSEPSCGILRHLLDLGNLCMISYGWLSLATSRIFQEAISYGNLCTRTH